MNKENCALKLVDEIILYCDARSKKHQTILKRLQMFKIGYRRKMDQILRKLLNIKNRSFIRAHGLCTCQVGVILYK